LPTGSNTAEPDSVYPRKVMDAGFEVAYDGMTVNL
jgi:hypothetical protein